MSKKKDRRLLYTSEQRANSPIWLTIYADLMTNLMLFFLMLWGLTRVSLESFSEAADSLRNKITKEGRNIEASVKISDDDDDDDGKNEIGCSRHQTCAGFSDTV